MVAVGNLDLIEIDRGTHAEIWVLGTGCLCIIESDLVATRIGSRTYRLWM